LSKKEEEKKNQEIEEKKPIILHISYRSAIASKYFITKKKKIFPEDVY
jgi:hypothetical protein